jgi:hypothetical protein
MEFPTHSLFNCAVISCAVKTEGKTVRKNEMGGACSAYGGEERCVQGSGGET